MKRHTSALAVLSRSLFVLVLSLCLGGPTLAADGPNEAAPAQTSQFAFLVGDHDCTTSRPGPEGERIEASATWKGRFILDGWAIQDDWSQKLPNGTVFHGTNIRSFNPKTEKWDNRWLPIGTLDWRYYEAEKVGDTMVMNGGDGEDANGTYTDRITFHTITDQGFEWFNDRSYDDGKTWIEKALIISCRRR